VTKNKTKERLIENYGILFTYQARGISLLTYKIDRKFAMVGMQIALVVIQSKLHDFILIKLWTLYQKPH
jgi:hypothetical protein